MLRAPFHRTAFPLAFLALITAGCEAPEPPGAGSGETDALDASVDFASVDRSGITGTVRTDDHGDEVEITIELEGLGAGTEYQAHIHSGRCAAGGPVAVPLGSITANREGAGRLTREVTGSQLRGDDPVFIQVHDAEGEAVACADLSEEEGDGRPVTERAERDTAEALVDEVR